MSFCPNTFIVVEFTVHFYVPSDVRHLQAVGAIYQTGPTPILPPHFTLEELTRPISTLKTWPVNSIADIAKTFVYVSTLDTNYTMPPKYRAKKYQVTRFSNNLPQWGWNTFSVQLMWNESASKLAADGVLSVQGEASIYQYSGDGVKINPPYPKIIDEQHPYQKTSYETGGIPSVFNFSLTCDPVTTVTTTTTTTTTTPSPIIITPATRKPTTTPTPVPTRKPYNGVIADCYTGRCKNLNF